MYLDKEIVVFCECADCARPHRIVMAVIKKDGTIELQKRLHSKVHHARIEPPFDRTGIM